MAQPISSGIHIMKTIFVNATTGIDQQNTLTAFDKIYILA